MNGLIEEDEEQPEPPIYTAPPKKTKQQLDAEQLTKDQASAQRAQQAIDAQRKLQQASALSQASADNITADSATEAAQLAARYCVPAQMVHDDIEEYRGRYKAEKTIERIEGRPVLGEWMSKDALRAAVAQEDIENLSALDDTFRFARRAIRTIPGVGAAGINAAGSGFWGMVQGLAESFEELNKENAQVEQQLYAAATGDDGQQQIIDTQTGKVRPTPAPIEHRLAYYAEGMRLASQSLRGTLVGKQIEEAGPLEQAIYGGLESAATSLSLAAVGVATGGGALLVAGAMGGTTFGSAYGQAADQGLRGWRAGMFGAVQGTIELATEYLPALKLLEGWAEKLPVAKLLMAQLAPELAGEEIATALQDLTEHFALPENKDKTLADYLRERPSAAVLTAASVVAALGAQGAGTAATRALMDRMGQQVGQSATYGRDPALIQDLLDKETKDTDLSHAFIPIQTWNDYWTGQGVDPRQKVEELLGSAKPHDDAMLSSAPLAIPMGIYGAHLVVDHGAGLNAEVKLLVGGELELNKRELEEVVADVDAHLAQIENSEDQDARDMMGAQREEFRQKLHKDLIASGYTEEQATLQASFVTGIMDAVSKSSGVNAYERSLLTVQQEQAAQPTSREELRALTPDGLQQLLEDPGVTDEAKALVAEEMVERAAAEGITLTELQQRTAEGDTLPTEFTRADGTVVANVFRGRQVGTPSKLAEWWTASRTMAKQFADTVRGRRKAAGEVITSQIEKSKVLPLGWTVTGYKTPNELAAALGVDVAELGLDALVKPDEQMRVHSMLEQQSVQDAIRKRGFQAVEAQERDTETTTAATYLVLNEPRAVDVTNGQAALDVIREAGFDVEYFDEETGEWLIEDTSVSDEKRNVGGRQRKPTKAVQAALATLNALPKDVVEQLIGGMVTLDQKAAKKVPPPPQLPRSDRAPQEVVNGALHISTRVPEAKKAPKRDEVLRTDMAAAQESPTIIAKFGKYFRGMRMLTAAEKSGDDQSVLDAFVARAERNLQFLWDQFPAEVRDRAKLWYVGANKIAHDMAARHGITAQQAAGVMAVLSPQMDWFKNVSLAERVMLIYNRMEAAGAKDTYFDEKLANEFERFTLSPVMPAYRALVKKGKTVEAEEYLAAAKSDINDILSQMRGKRWGDLNEFYQAHMLRTIDQLENTRHYHVITPEGEFGDLVRNKDGKTPANLGWGTYPVIANAIAIMRDKSDEVLDVRVGGQHKVRSFYNNIIDPNNADAVTIDTHAVAAAHLEPFSGEAPEVKKTMGGITDSHVGISGTNAIYAQAYFNLAKRLGVLPREAQSVTWEVARGLYTPDLKKSVKASQNAKAGAEAAPTMVSTAKRLWNEFAEGTISEETLYEELVSAAGGIALPAWVNTPPGSGTNESNLSAGYARGNSADVPAGRGARSASARLAAGKNANVAAGALRDTGARALRQQTAGTEAEGVAPQGALAAQGIRGQINYYSLITEAGRRQFTVTLSEKRDLTTFLHEVGHFLHETLRDVATRPGALPQIIADKAALDAWVGATPDQVNYTVKQQEKFARGFEAFIMEGKAPTKGLEAAFATMRGWLVEAYKNLLGLEIDAGHSVQLTDEVREVFSRLVAADAAVNQAQLEAGHMPMFKTAAEAGMSEEEFEQYRTDSIVATERAKTELGQRLLEEAQREESKVWHTERDKVRAEIRDEVHAQPIYQVMAAMQRGTTPDGQPLTEGQEPEAMPLDVAALAEVYSPEEVASLQRRGLASTSNGASAEMLADWFGFTSADALVQALLETPPADVVINQRADAVMRSRHGDLTHDPSQLKRAAEEAVRGDERERVIMDELAALVDKANDSAKETAAAALETPAPAGPVSLSQTPADGEGQPPAAPTEPAQGQPAAPAAAVPETAQKSPEVPRGTSAPAVAGRRVPGFVPREKLRNAQKQAATELKLKQAETKLKIAEAEQRKQGEIDKLKALVKDLRSQLAHGKAERAYERRWMDAEAKRRAAIAKGESKAVIDKLTKEVARLKRLMVTGGATIRRALPSVKQLRNYAKWRIRTIPIKDIRPSVYLQASMQASRRATELAAQGRFDEAIRAKTSELTSLHLYQQAVLLLKETDKRVRYARGLSERAGRERIGKAGGTYLDQIDGILDRFDFARVSQKTLDRRANIKKWVESQEGQGLPVELPEEVMNEAFRKNYSELTADELIAVTDGLRTITSLAGLKNRLLASKDKREFDAIIADAVEHMERYGRVRKQKLGFDPIDEKFHGIAGFFAAHRKMSEILQALDGYVEGGPLHTLIMVPLNNAANEEHEQFTLAGEAWNALIDKHYGNWSNAGLRQKVYIKEIGASLSREWLLSIGLNSGNADNRARLENDPSRKWTPAQVDAIRGYLTKADWDFIQDTWDLLDSYWPQIAAKQTRVNGVPPPKVEALEVETKFGTYRGGYYPLVYDPRLDEKAAQDKPITEAKLQMAAAYISTTTARGHTEARKDGVQRAIRFDLGVVPGHLQQVIHDLTHHEALIDASRILRNPDIRRVIQERKGDQVLKQLVNGLQAIAQGTTPNGPMDAAASWMRSGSQMAGLGFNFWTAVQQPLGLFNGMARVGPKWVAKGIGQWLVSPLTMDHTVQWIASRSLLMKNRMSTSQQDIHDLKQALAVSGGWFDRLVRTVTFGAIGRKNLLDSYMWHIGLMQRVADVPTWLGQYEKSMAGGFPEEQAIAHADQAVLDSQGGGQMKDLAAIQRGPAVAKLFMTFYSYGNTVFGATAREVGKFNQTRTPSGAARMLGNLGLIYVMPAVLSIALKRALGGGDDDDDDESWAEYFLEVGGEVGSSAMNTMVLVRELGGVLKDSNRGYAGPAGTRIFQQLGQTYKQVLQGEADEAFWKSLNSTAGVLAGWPAAQAQRSVEGYWAIEEGKTRNPFALVMGAPPD